MPTAMTSSLIRRVRRARAVRARTTMVATAVVAAVLLVAVVGLTWTVELTLTRQLQARGDALVDHVIAQLRAGAQPRAAVDRALQATAPSDSAADVPTYLAILDRDGAPVFGSGFFSMPGMTQDGQGVTTTGAPWGSPSVRVGSPDLTVAQQSIDIDGELLLVVAASPLADVVRSVEAITRTALIGMPLIVALVGIVTWTATGRTLRPIDRIRDEVDGLSSQTLGRRVSVPATDDEVARLATTFNRMLGRLETASARQRAFVSDASHELRSPLAAIRAELEVALAHPDTSTLHDVATGALTEVDRMEQLIDNLLVLARIDEGAAPATTAVDFGHLVRQAATRPAAVTVDAHVSDGVLVTGNERDLASVVRNLVDNAVRHATSCVTITATARDGHVTFTVDDDGPGIAPCDRKRVFERFTRIEHARGRADGGVGLGLAVVDRVVRHHNGVIEVTDSPAAGARFEVRFPAAP